MPDLSGFAGPLFFGQPLLHDLEAIKSLFVTFGDALKSFAGALQSEAGVVEAPQRLPEFHLFVFGHVLP
jgi:hypothetical protein